MMTRSLTEQVRAALAGFSSASRLYEIVLGDDCGIDANALLVEAFVAEDAIHATGMRDLIVLAISAHVELEPLLGQAAMLEMSLANGTRTRFAGDIEEVEMLGSDGGLARYRLRIAPWTWRLAHTRNSRVWQERRVVDIIDAVFAAYLPQARWRWSDDVASCMVDVPPRSYCCQYRESDHDFVRRLLAEEGLSWRFSQDEDGPCMVLFADSRRPCAVPEDASCAIDGPIRYHAASGVESRDTVQSLVEQRRLHASSTTLLSSDYKARQVVAAGSPSLAGPGRRLPPLEWFDVPGQYAFPSRRLAQHYADLRMEAQEAGGQVWHGQSTVRTLRAGTRLIVTGLPFHASREACAFLASRVLSIGINNLPAAARHALDGLFGPVPALLRESALRVSPGSLDMMLTQARATGYANCFDAVPADVPWRPALDADAAPTASGSQSAIVVGADGGNRPDGADELYCDRLGRVRIRFHWQDTGAACWVRVAQRAAGGGMGSQFLPRIGQEVLVQFLENDIDRPIIVGALYNGRGEGGIPPTPGGRIDAASKTTPFAPAHDHARSGQGNLSGGNSPVWHGAAAGGEGHRNPAAQWGLRSKEFGGSGYNQLLFDDTDAQGRVQLKSTHAASELNLGHLIHAADNYRGSLRGRGAELRTDAYGAVRAGKDLLVSSYAIAHSALSREPVGENAAAVGMLGQAAGLVEALHAAAVTHRTVGLASHLGAAEAGASALDDRAAPLKAMLASLGGMVGKDGANVDPGAAPGGVELPHSSDPLIAIAAREGFAASAGQGVQMANGETVLLASGQDAQLLAGGRMRLHTGQAIGVLGGAIEPGAAGHGLQLVAAREAVDMQAQADGLTVQARDEVDVISAHAHIDWAAAKRISLSTAGGANITIEGGNIPVQCPGKITVRAGKKSFTGPEKSSFDMPALPGSICVACLKKSLAAGPAFTMVQ